ncbi:hypothetical protein [Streptomyces sp. NPDC048442]|uniref:hypothetical protein n=1 Tax=Streptomyces sp. NPDC048442 TaxID=3154823 RepID=UPI003438CF0D
MSVSYRNTNTGDIARYDRPNARLEMLPNWERYSDGDGLPNLVNDGVLSRPTLTAPGVHDPSADVPLTNEELRKENPAGVPTADTVGTTEDGEVSGVSKPPSRKASKTDWQAYARLVEDDPERQSDIEGMTRDQLAERYGS